MTDKTLIQKLEDIRGEGLDYRTYKIDWPSVVAVVAEIDANRLASPKFNESHVSDEINQHEVADSFWQCWRENGETNKHGYYESTWMSIRAALRAALEPR